VALRRSDGSRASHDGPAPARHRDQGARGATRSIARGKREEIAIPPSARFLYHASNMARPLRRAAALCSTLLALAPAAARADDGPAPAPAPSGEETSPRWWLVGTGATVFGLAYGASALSAISNQHVTDVDRAAFGWMYVPLAGPFVTAASGDLRRDEKVTVPLLGAAQIAGASAAVAGLVFARERSRTSALVVPGGPAGAAGASVVGTF
jgi:hypothetical protein